MLSKFIAVPFVILAIACLYFVWEGELEPIYIVPWVVMLAVTFVLSPQIDWWWANRNPPPVDPRMEGFLRKFFPYYASLSLPFKKRFANRVSLYIMATEFIPKAIAEVPEDVKGLIAANVVMLTFGQEEYRLSKFEKIVAYPHPFPSPQYPKDIHSSEIFEEDGVILFSLEQMIPGASKRNQYYNIALHEYAKIFTRMYKDHPYPKFDDSIWEKLEQISGFKTEAVKNYIGLPFIEPLPVSINYFFTFPEKFKAVLPSLSETYSRIFNQDPTNKEKPVIDVAKQGKRI